MSNFVNDFEYKKDKHWSETQKETAVFSSGFEIKNRKKAPKIIVHLGPHKTGTTSFQNILEANERELNNNNINLITVRSSFSLEYKRLRNKYTIILQGALISDSLENELVIDKLSSVLKEMVACTSTKETELVLLADENLLGPPTGHYFAGRKGRELGYYSLHKLVFRSIKMAFGDQLEKIIITDRGFSGFLPSSYKDFISKLTDVKTFDEFKLELNERVKEEYKGFFYNAEIAFGGKLKVYNFDVFCRTMPEEAFNITKVAMDEEINKKIKSNASISERGIEIALKVIPLLESQSEKNHFRRFLMSLK